MDATPDKPGADTHQSARRMNSAILAGFGIVLLTMAALTAIALNSMQQLQDQMEMLVTEHNRRTGLLYTLRISARERILSLHHLLGTVDPFERDDEWMHHKELATGFIAARTELLGQVWDDEARALLDELARVTRYSQPLQQDVIRLAQEGDDYSAYHTLVKAQVAQDGVLVVLDQLLERQQVLNQQSLEAAQADYRRAFALMLGLGLLTFAIAVAAALFARRRVVMQARHLSDANRRLEDSNEQLGEATERAQQASRMKSEFLANMSHEIRTPLTAIRGSIVLMKGGAVGELPDKMKDVVEIACRNTERLLFLLNDILDFSKIEAGRLVVENGDFMVQSELDAVMELFRLGAAEKDIELSLEPTDPNLGVHADPDRLRQVLVNLVGNGVKFTERGGVRLRVVRVMVNGRWMVRFEVIDSGVGIPEAALPALFEVFVQADGTTSRTHGGTGLGLAICERLVMAMDGEIGVESRPGVGSTFWFLLPAAKNQMPQPPRLSMAG